jgi:hypothetical protein
MGGERLSPLRTFANIGFRCSPAQAGVQEREALLRGCGGKPLPCSGLGPGLRRGTTMKQLNVWPMLIMLIVIVLLVIWLRPHG